MANTSLSLGKYWEDFIKAQIATGRYGSASEVVRDGLRVLETESEKLSKLKELLQPGLEQIGNGELIRDFDMDDFISLKKHTKK